MPQLPFRPSGKRTGERLDPESLDPVLPHDAPVVSGPFKTKFGEWEVLIFSEPDSFAEVRIPSSKEGQFYGVTVTRNSVSCECKGFGYRETCRHVKLVKEALIKSASKQD